MCHSMPNVPLVNLSLKLIWSVGLGLAKEKKNRPPIIVNECKDAVIMRLDYQAFVAGATVILCV